MTFEEIQRTIEGMLAVQRDMQEKQLANCDRIAESDERFNEKLNRITEIQEGTDKKLDRLTSRIDNLTEQVEHLNVVSQKHEDRFTQFYGYHQAAEGDRLRMLETQNRIAARLDAIEDKLDAR